MYKIPKIIVEVRCKLVLILKTRSRLNTPLRFLNFIMAEYNRCVATFKENLPAKCVRHDGFSSFLWIQPPIHDNFTNIPSQFRFCRALKDVVKLHVNAFTLKKVWDAKDCSLVVESMNAHKLTSVGYRSYWEAV